LFTIWGRNEYANECATFANVLSKGIGHEKVFKYFDINGIITSLINNCHRCFLAKIFIRDYFIKIQKISRRFRSGTIYCQNISSQSRDPVPSIDSFPQEEFKFLKSQYV
jgi:hypothetical protein